jgi:hypothetical protein
MKAFTQLAPKTPCSLIEIPHRLFRQSMQQSVAPVPVTNSPLEGTIMAAQLLYFGQDDSHRVQVLQCAGYDVRECSSPQQLTSILCAGIAFDAILVNEEELALSPEILPNARAAISAPVVLFHHNCTAFDSDSFDLVIHNLTPPNQWLSELRELIEQTRTKHARAGKFTAESVRLSEDYYPQVEESFLERERTHRESDRAIHYLPHPSAR